MNRPIALCCGDRFWVLHNGLKLLCSVANVVLTQDTSNSLIASIGFHNGLNGTIDMREHRGA